MNNSSGRFTVHPEKTSSQLYRSTYCLADDPLGGRAQEWSMRCPRVLQCLTLCAPRVAELWAQREEMPPSCRLRRVQSEERVVLHAWLPQVLTRAVSQNVESQQCVVIFALSNLRTSLFETILKTWTVTFTFFRCKNIKGYKEILDSLAQLVPYFPTCVF